MGIKSVTNKALMDISADLDDNPELGKRKFECFKSEWDKFSKEPCYKETCMGDILVKLGEIEKKKPSGTSDTATAVPPE